MGMTRPNHADTTTLSLKSGLICVMDRARLRLLPRVYWMRPLVPTCHDGDIPDDQSDHRMDEYAASPPLRLMLAQKINRSRRFSRHGSLRLNDTKFSPAKFHSREALMLCSSDQTSAIKSDFSFQHKCRLWPSYGTSRRSNLHFAWILN